VLNLKEKMKNISLIIALLFSVVIFDSCKKGCTDPYAYNYNANREIDNGSCNIYSHVVLHSVDIQSIPEYNSLGYPWDAGFGDDLDNDNSYPDLYVHFRADSGYSYNSSSWNWYDVDFNNVNVNQDLSVPLSLSAWRTGGFWVYLEEVDNGWYKEHIDSIFVDPFDYDATYNRFLDTLVVTKGEIQLTANMEWFQ
jgi:hypothetical protein